MEPFPTELSSANPQENNFLLENLLPFCLEMNCNIIWTLVGNGSIWIPLSNQKNKYQYKTFDRKQSCEQF